MELLPDRYAGGYGSLVSTFFIDCFCEKVYIVIRGRTLSHMVTFRNLFY